MYVALVVVIARLDFNMGHSQMNSFDKQEIKKGEDLYNLHKSIISHTNLSVWVGGCVGVEGGGDGGVWGCVEVCHLSNH